MTVYEKHYFTVKKHDTVKGYTVLDPDGLPLGFYFNKKEAIKRVNKELRKGIFIRVPMKNYLEAKAMIEVLGMYGVDASISEIK